MRLNLDEFLGPSGGRFFSSGYKSSRRRYDELTLNDDGTTLDGFGAFTYPSGWSRKGDEDQPPHLSTVDALVVALELGQKCLGGFGEVPHGPWNEATIDKVVISAGGEPVTDLQRVPIHVSVTHPREGKEEELTARILASVGALNVRLNLSRAQRRANHQDVLGTYWIDGYTTESHSLSPVTVDQEALEAQANVTWMGVASGDSATGLGHRGEERPSALDTFVVLMQLGQALLYLADDVSRSESSTLWMQQVRLVRTGESFTPPSSLAVMHMSTPEHLELPTGSWSNAQFKGTLGYYELSANFAHKLPKSKES